MVDSERFQHAISLRDAGKTERALKEFEVLASLEKDPYNKGIMLLGQATCLFCLGRVKEARERLSESVKWWTNIHTEFLDACLCGEEGKREEAVQKLTLFLESHGELKDPGNEDTYSQA